MLFSIIQFLFVLFPLLLCLHQQLLLLFFSSHGFKVVEKGLGVVDYATQ